MEEVDATFGLIHTPARILLAGCTGSGKSFFARSLIEHRKDIFTSDFDKIIYVIPKHASVNRSEFLDSLKTIYPSIIIIEGFKEAMATSNFAFDNLPKLLILDDLISELMKAPEFLDRLIKDSHHSNITVIFSSQYLYFPSKFSTTIRGQISEIVVFYEKGNMAAVKKLGTRYYTGAGESNLLLEAMEYLLKENEEHSKYILLG